MAENKIVPFEFKADISVQENIKSLLLTKINLKKSLKMIEKFEGIYEDEIAEEAKNMHITRDGDVLFISDMDNDHLVNTVKALLNRGYDFRNANVKRYMTEVKKRNLVGDIASFKPLVQEQDEDDEDFIGEPDF